MKNLETDQKSNRLSNKLGRVLVLLSAFLMFLLMCLTVVDVAGRNILNYPLPGGYEVTALVMLVLFFLSLPIVSQKETHITVNLFDNIIGKNVRWLLDLIYYTLSAGALALMARYMLRMANELLEYNDVTLYLQIPQAPFFYFATFCTASTALIYCLKLIRLLTGGTK